MANTDCYFYFVGGACSHNDCRFRHTQTAQMRKPTCRFWTAGRCQNPSCPFSHNSFDVEEKPICKYNFHGRCSKGDSCTFSHSSIDSANRVHFVDKDASIVDGGKDPKRIRSSEILGKYSSSNVYKAKKEREPKVIDDDPSEPVPSMVCGVISATEDSRKGEGMGDRIKTEDMS